MLVAPVHLGQILVDVIDVVVLAADEDGSVRSHNRLVRVIAGEHEVVNDDLLLGQINRAKAVCDRDIHCVLVSGHGKAGDPDHIRAHRQCLEQRAVRNVQERYGRSGANDKLSSVHEETSDRRANGRLPFLRAGSGVEGEHISGLVTDIDFRTGGIDSRRGALH